MSQKYTFFDSLFKIAVKESFYVVTLCKQKNLLTVTAANRSS